MAGLPAGYGVTAAGFIAPDIDAIISAMEADEQAAFGASIDLSSTSNLGQLNGVLGAQISSLWDLGLAIYTAQTAEGATGTAEDSVNSLTGCVRLPAVASLAQLVLVGTNATSITDGIVSTGGTSPNEFEFPAATLATATAWASGTVYAAGAIVKNDSPTKVYYATMGGTSAGSGGPTGTGSVIVDNTVTWAYAGTGAAFASVSATATVTGPIAAPVASLTTIVTPVSGWSNSWNPAAAVLGSNVETDSAYRLRRDNELGAEGLAYLDAIRAAVLNVDAGTANAVTACTVFENYTDVTVDGIPPHAVECLVQGGLDLDVAEAIFRTVAAGILPFGQTNTVTETVTDSAGNPHTVEFSRPTAVPIYVTIDVTVNPDSPNFNPTDGGQAAIAAQIVAWGNALGAGFDVTASYASAQAFIANVGAWQVTACYVGTAPSPGGSEVVISARELPTFTGANIAVHITQTPP